MTRVLLLAGTAEARALAAQVAGRVDLLVSLAGVTRHPEAYSGTLRTGGFGGGKGLAAFLTRERIDAVIDATHPFADTMAANAAFATASTQRPLLRLCRPPWQPRRGEVWHHHRDLTAAVSALPPEARPFLATGAGTVRVLRRLPLRRATLRSIDPLHDVPPGITHIRARPPFSVESETALLQDIGATHVVARNSGGATGREKLDAAARLGLPVLMIDRPLPPSVDATATSVSEALDWLRLVSALDTPSNPAP